MLSIIWPEIAQLLVGQPLRSSAEAKGHSYGKQIDSLSSYSFGS